MKALHTSDTMSILPASDKMSLLQCPKCKELRRQIQAHRIKRLGWSDYVFHFIMEGLGYGRSLRDLDEQRLSELWEIVKGYRKHGRPVEFNYDRQGRYMHALMKQAGWEEATLRAYLVINYKKTHWNLLDKGERRQVIELLKGLEAEGLKGRELEPGQSPEDLAGQRPAFHGKER